MTAITINVPNREVSFFKKMIKKLGWTYTEADVESATAKPRLYDSEAGEYLNEKTMKAIEDMRIRERLTIRLRILKKPCVLYEATIRNKDF